VQRFEKDKREFTNKPPTSIGGGRGDKYSTSERIRFHDKATAHIDKMGAPYTDIGDELNALSSIVSKYSDENLPGWPSGVRNFTGVHLGKNREDAIEIDKKIKSIVTLLVKRFSGVAARPDEVKRQADILGDSLKQGGPSSFRRSLNTLKRKLVGWESVRRSGLHPEVIGIIRRSELSDATKRIGGLNFDYKKPKEVKKPKSKAHTNPGAILDSLWGEEEKKEKK
jgi:hypothetical protein